MTDAHEQSTAVTDRPFVGGLAVIPPQEMNPAAELGVSSRAAGACKQIVLATAVSISGRKHVRCEGWQAIAIAHGCVASSRAVERTETGFRAIGEVRRRDTGVVIAEAEGFVGDDEQMWANRPEYARRAMAQTRAISRACRSAFAHVVVMMNAGLETTPAEEMPPERGSRPRAQPLPPRDGHAVTDAQRKRLWTIAKAAGHTNDDVKLYLEGAWHLTSSNDIRPEDYDTICNRLAEKTPLNEPEPPPSDANEEWRD